MRGHMTKDHADHHVDHPTTTPTTTKQQMMMCNDDDDELNINPEREFFGFYGVLAGMGDRLFC